MREFDLIVEKLLVGEPLTGEAGLETERAGEPVEVERAVAEPERSSNPSSVSRMRWTMVAECSQGRRR